MTKKDIDKVFANLPACAVEYIQLVIKKMRYRKKVRADVQSELIAHFEDALRDCQNAEEKERIAEELIAEFGDAKILGKLARRAKKRCRPMWVKAVIGSLKFIGICILYIIICSSLLVIGRPSITVNYVDWLNDSVRAGRDKTDNAREYYQKAGELVVEMPEWLKKSRAKWPTDFNDAETKNLSKWLNDNLPAMEELRKGAEKPYYWNLYKSEDDNLMTGQLVSNVMKPLGNFRKLAQTMYWQIGNNANLGNTDKAIEDCLVLCRFGKQQRGHGLLIEQLVGVAIGAMGDACIYEILYRFDLQKDLLQRLQQEYESIITDANIFNLEAEKVFLYDLIQRKFTDDGKGGGRPIREGTGFAGRSPAEIIFNILTFNLPDKEEVVAHVDQIYEYYQECFKTPNFKQVKQRFNQAIENSPMLIKILMPDYERIFEHLWRLKTNNGALVTTIALLRYEKERGRHPESLEELLQAGFVHKMPFDFYRNGPLTYKKTEGDFVLYSFGPDFDDDGGVSGTNRGKSRKWADNGDTVFWPGEK